MATGSALLPEGDHISALKRQERAHSHAAAEHQRAAALLRKRIRAIQRGKVAPAAPTEKKG